MPTIEFPGGRLIGEKNLEPTITIRGEGGIYLNKASISRLGAPCRINVYFDTDDHTLILEKKQDGKVKVESVGKGMGGRINSKALANWLKEFGIKEGKYLGTWDGDKNSLVFKVEGRIS